MPDLNPLGNGHSESIYMAPQFCLLFSCRFFLVCMALFTLLIPCGGWGWSRGLLYSWNCGLWEYRPICHPLCLFSAKYSRSLWPKCTQKLTYFSFLFSGCVCVCESADKEISTLKCWYLDIPPRVGGWQVLMQTRCARHAWWWIAVVPHQVNILWLWARHSCDWVYLLAACDWASYLLTSLSLSDHLHDENNVTALLAGLWRLEIIYVLNRTQNLYKSHSITGRHRQHDHYYCSYILSLLLITWILSFLFFLFSLFSHSLFLYSLLPVPQLSDWCPMRLLRPNSNPQRKRCCISLFSMTSQRRNSQRECHLGNIVSCIKVSNALNQCSVDEVTPLPENAECLFYRSYQAPEI